MKFTVAILVFAVVVFESVQTESTIEIIRSCKEKTNCKEDIVKQMKAHEDPKTDECFCALGCLGKEKGIFTETMGLDKDKFRAILKKMHMTQNKIDGIVEKCDISGAGDECAAAKALSQCMKS